MKRISYLPFTITLLAACGSDPAPSHQDAPMSDAEVTNRRDFAEQAASLQAQFPARARARKPLLHDPDPTYFTAWNNQVNIPQQHTNGSACYMTWVQGWDGYAGQPVWPNGMPKYSASWYFERYFPSTMNVVSAQYLDDVGGKIAQVACSPLTDFHNIGTTSQAHYGFSRLIGSGYGQGPYDVEVQLHDTNSFCYLMHVGGMPHGGAAEYLYTKAHGGSPTGYYWYLRHSGTSADFNARANCVNLGRPAIITIFAANTNAPALMEPPGTAACGLLGLWGDVNANGTAQITTVYSPDTLLRLAVYGGVFGAVAACAYYWDEQ